MKIEPYGLEPVPESERTASWRDLLYIWSAISFCIPSFIVGAILVPSFSWGEAMSINILGNLAVGCLIVLGGYFGTRTGLPAVLFGKSVFGEKMGQAVPTACLIMSTLGWYAVITAITGQALDQIVKLNLGYSNPVLFIVLMGILNSYAAVSGFESIKSFSRLSIPLLAVFSLGVVIHLVAGNAGEINFDYTKTGGMSYWEGIDLVIGGYIAGALAASDFSRHASGNRANWLGVLPGTFVVSALLGAMGMLLTAATGEWNPVREVQGLGLGIPALLFIFVANWTTNFNLLYSSGLAVTNIFPGISRWKNTLWCGIAGTVLAAAGIADRLQDMLSLLALLFSPVLGVLLTDFFVVSRIKKRDVTIPVRFNIPGLIAILAGLASALFFSQYTGASITGFIAGSLAYLFISAINRRHFR